MEIETKKRSVWLLVGIAVLVVIVVLVFFFGLREEKRHKLTQEEVLEAATGVVGLYRGDTSYRDRIGAGEVPVLPSFTQNYDAFQASLKAKDEQKVNVEEHYQSLVAEEKRYFEEWDEYDAPTAGDEGEPEKIGLVKPQQRAETFPDDERIVKEGDSAYIKVSDFDFAENPTEIVDYKNKHLVYTADMVPESYAAMLASPSSWYVYDSSLEGKDEESTYTDVLFKSSSGGPNVIVRIYHTTQKITDLEVRR